MPKGAIVAATAKLPPPLQRFAPGESARRGHGAQGAYRVPAERREPRTGRQRTARSRTRSPIKIAGGTPPLNVLMNGMPLAAKKSARTLFFEPDGPGFVRLTVTDATGAADSVVVRLQ